MELAMQSGRSQYSGVLPNKWYWWQLHLGGQHFLGHPVSPFFLSAFSSSLAFSQLLWAPHLPSIFPFCVQWKVFCPTAASYRCWVIGKSLTMVSEFLNNLIISPKRGECEQNRKKHVGSACSTKTKVNQIQVWSINNKLRLGFPTSLPRSAFTSSLDLLPIKPAPNSITLDTRLFSSGCCTPDLWSMEYACWFHLLSHACLSRSQPFF